nr:hypothetical protein [Microbacterium immunditiarum]
MATGCSGQPAPEPSTPSAPTFASDEEAFAAAEETYRAYVDALNAVDLSDPATFEPVFAWLTGDASADARQQLSEMHANGWQVEGTTAIVLAEGRPPGSAFATALNVCEDVSDVDVVDATGTSVVSGDRPDVQPVLVGFELSVTSPTGLLMSSIEGRQGPPLCEQ